MTGTSVPIVFIAGVISFVSPCVLPLVPGYLSYMSGVAAGEADAGRRGSLRTVVMALTFTLGFTLVFVPLGATATLLGSFLTQEKQLFARVGGVLIILLGLVFMGVIKIPWLYREARFHPTPKAGYWGSLVLGGAFAFGWSPCIGPVLGGVLTLAAGTSDRMAEGAGLLAIYSLGLGVPFILVALGLSRLTVALSWLRRHTRAINLASGVLLVIVGVLFFTERLFEISIWIQKTFVALNLDFLARI